MVVGNDQLKKIVLGAKLVTPEVWDAVLQNAERRGRDVESVLIEGGHVGSAELYERVAEFLKVPYVDLRKEKIDFNVLKLLLEKTVIEHKAIPFRKPDDSSLDVAFLRPQDTPAIDEIQKVTGLKVRPYLTGKKSFAYAYRLYQRDLAVELEQVLDDESPKSGRGKARKTPQEFPVVKVLDTILTHAVMADASDVHLEPLSDALLVRFRIDGILRDMLELPLAAMLPLNARVKILTNLKIDEHRVPQDGRMSFFAESENVFVRVSTLPTFYGEKIVMRILNEQERQLKLQDLGMEGRALDAVLEAVDKPRGLVLVVGPTGSGKTTTLYTILGMLNTEGVNVSTIEDPIEYGLPRVNQTQVNPRIGYTFAMGLRALLRQDPNVIMIGEVRDKETADTAVQSGLTGHLVLTTLHTMDAAGVIPRLTEMDIKPFVLVSTLRLAIAQRLVRKVCPDCTETYQLNAADAVQVASHFPMDAIFERLRRQGLIGRGVRNIRDLTLSRGRGCNQCLQSGYQGRIGVYEVLEMTESVRKAIVEGQPYEGILYAARRDGMTTLLEDGWIKVVRGATTVEELLRVLQE